MQHYPRASNSAPDIPSLTTLRQHQQDTGTGGEGQEMTIRQHSVMADIGSGEHEWQSKARQRSAQNITRPAEVMVPRPRLPRENSVSQPPPLSSNEPAEMAERCDERMPVEVAARNGQRLGLFFGYHFYFSNFHPCKFILDDREWNCTEHYYVYAKLVHFGQTRLAEQIAARVRWSPGEMKRVGGQVEEECPVPLLREQWTEVKVEVMRRCVWAKFRQNLHLGQRLLATRGLELIEASATDRFWGSGLPLKPEMDSRLVAKHADSVAWRLNGGRNMLGVVLMWVRDRLVDDGCVRGGSGRQEIAGWDGGVVLPTVVDRHCQKDFHGDDRDRQGDASEEVLRTTPTSIQPIAASTAHYGHIPTTARPEREKRGFLRQVHREENQSNPSKRIEQEEVPECCRLENSFAEIRRMLSCYLR